MSLLVFPPSQPLGFGYETTGVSPGLLEGTGVSSPELLPMVALNATSIALASTRFLLLMARCPDVLDLVMTDKLSFRTPEP